MGLKKSYLVTGGAGFIGSNFVRHVFNREPDASIRVLDKLTYAGNMANLSDFEGNSRFRFMEGDICDETTVRKAMEGVDVVINFAAEAAVDRSIERPDSFLKTDVYGVYVLLNEAKSLNNLEKFIQISTDEVYGHIMEGSFREDSELRPRNPYAASKCGGERLAYSYFETYNMPVCITRASNNYGPYAYPEKVIPLFITNLIDNLKVPVYGEGKQIRDWLHVHDHCDAISTIIKKGKNGEVYNVGGSHECNNLDLTKMLLKLLDKDERFIHFVEDRPGHDFRYSLNCDKLKKLGWQQKYSFQEGLKQTVEWYKNHEDWWRPIKGKMDKKYITGFWGEKKCAV